MTQANRKRPRKKGRTRKSSRFDLKRAFIYTVLFFVLIVSICAVGYVIFFRTVVATEILPALRSAIVFEEPDPPVQLEHPDQIVAPGREMPESASQLKAESKGEEDGGAPGRPLAGQSSPGRRPDLPMVAIIIDDMGYDAAAGKELLEMPIDLTYSFLPFAPHTKNMGELAHAKGKSIFLHLPLQPKGTYNPGPGALYLRDSPETQRAKLHTCLQEVPHAVGINNHMGSSFTESEQAMTNIIQEMKGKALIFVDSCTSASSVAFQVARAASLKSARRNVFLDNIQDEREICVQLEKLVEIAERKGRAIGIAHPYRSTVNALTECSGKYLERVRYVGVPEVLSAR